MTVTLNHTIIHASDKTASAKFYTSLLGLASHKNLGPFAVVQVGDTSLDFIETDEEITSRHFAFQVSEAEFDDIFGRIQALELPIWADPFKKHPGEINHWDDGRGVYFPDPDGHLLEILTRPYGSGGLEAEYVNPMLR